MITFNDLDLFSSGPATIKPGPIESRDAVMDSPGSIGATLVTQGITPRTITQQGMLIADTEPMLRTLIDAVEAEVAGRAATLIDEQGHDWPGCVIRAFAHELISRHGPRYAVDYTVTYLQTCP